MDSRILKKKCYLCCETIDKKYDILDIYTKSDIEFISYVYNICDCCMIKYTIIKRTFELCDSRCLGDNESTRDHATMIDLIESIKSQSLNGSAGVL
jgi:hypothetical protein